MVFIVLEGFSGSGKTTIAKKLEERGWIRLAESAHALPNEVPLAERANTYSDYSLVGATMQYCYVISSYRAKKDIVSEGYFVSDLTYAMIRQKLKKSRAFPALLRLSKVLLRDSYLQPDMYILLRASSETIKRRQAEKGERERNESRYFETSYYRIIRRLHRELGQPNVESILTELEPEQTFSKLESVLKKRGLLDGNR